MIVPALLSVSAKIHLILVVRILIYIKGIGLKPLLTINSVIQVITIPYLMIKPLQIEMNVKPDVRGKMVADFFCGGRMTVPALLSVSAEKHRIIIIMRVLIYIKGIGLALTMKNMIMR